METPCIDICVLDNASGQCAGCGRTIGEITRWAGMTAGERRTVMADLPLRAGPHRDARGKAPPKRLAV